MASGTRMKLLASCAVLLILAGPARGQGNGPAMPAEATTGAGPDLEALIQMVREKTIFADLPAGALREAGARGIVELLDRTLGSGHAQALQRPGRDARARQDAQRRPVNAFYTPREFRLWRQEVAGKFGGIGARIAMSRRRADQVTSAGAVSTETSALEIEEPIAGAAAERGGLKPGDLIVAIDGEPVAGKSLEALVDRLRGAAGTPVDLKVVRNGQVPFDVKLVRSEVRMPAVTFEPWGGGGGRICLRSLNPETSSALATALASASAAGAESLVLDLRECPGGMLDVAVEVAGAFLPEGSPVIRLSHLEGGEEVLSTTGTPRFDGPLVVLVDRRTASGGEILAAAFQDHRRGLVAGEETFGKRTAETVFELPGGYGVKLTTSLFRRPGLSESAGPGFPVSPDVSLEASGPAREGPGAAGTDPLLRAAAALLEWHRQGATGRRSAGGSPTPE